MSAGVAAIWFAAGLFIGLFSLFNLRRGRKPFQASGFAFGLVLGLVLSVQAGNLPEFLVMLAGFGLTTGAAQWWWRRVRSEAT